MKVLGTILLKTLGLFVALFVIIAAGIYWATPEQKQQMLNASVAQSSPSPSKKACPQKWAAKFVQKAQEAGVVHRIDTNSSVPKIYVRPAWYELTIEDKTTFDGALQCFLSGDGRERVLAVYKDFRSGKDVADTSRYGFEMK